MTCQGVLSECFGFFFFKTRKREGEEEECGVKEFFLDFQFGLANNLEWSST